MSQRRRAHQADDDRPAVVSAPPHNLDAERSVLGAILIDNDAYLEASRVLVAQDFYRHGHQLVFAAMTALQAQSIAMDPVTLREELLRAGALDDAGGPVYLAALTNGVPRTVNVRHYASIVSEKALARRVIYQAQRLVADCYAQEDPVLDVLARGDVALLQLRQGYREGEQLVPLSAEVPGLMADLEQRVARQGQLTGADTGFTSINDITFGWQGGDLIILAARPSMGKTALLLNMLMAAVEQPHPSRTRTGLIFSMEMKRRQLHYRLLSALSGIPALKLLGGFMPAHQGPEWAALAKATERMDAAGLLIDDRPARTVTDIRAECRRVQAERGLDIVAVDYVQLMKGTPTERRNVTRTEELTEISRQLKVLSGELDVPFIVVSQLRRVLGRPKMDDLRESGSLEQDADIVALLHRGNHKANGTTEFILEKNRNGPTGTVYLTFTKEVVRFDDGGEPEPEKDADVEQKKQRKRGHFARRAAGR